VHASLECDLSNIAAKGIVVSKNSPAHDTSEYVPFLASSESPISARKKADWAVVPPTMTLITNARN